MRLNGRPLPLDSTSVGPAVAMGGSGTVPGAAPQAATPSPGSPSRCGDAWGERECACAEHSPVLSRC